MGIPVIYEDASLIAIDKPAGVVVNRAENVQQDTIQDWAEEKLKIKSENLPAGEAGLKVGQEDFYKRAGIVHRLDKETSGILLIAKNPEVFLQLQLQFQNRTVTKKYQTLVHGLVKPPEGLINVPLGRLPWDRKKFGALVSGRPAETSYKVISYYQYHNQQYSFLEVTPHTGRTHQIRIHLKYLGHTVVGDMLYAGRKIYQEDLQFCSRLFLHAVYLSFQHPVTFKMIEINCKLSIPLQSVLNNIYPSQSELLRV